MIEILFNRAHQRLLVFKQQRKLKLLLGINLTLGVKENGYTYRYKMWNIARTIFLIPSFPS